MVAGLNLMVQENLSQPLVKEQVSEMQTWETTFWVVMIFNVGDQDQAGKARFFCLQNLVKTHCSMLNLASLFASSKTPIFNKGFAHTNVHWNLYIIFYCNTLCFALHFTMCRTHPTFEVWPHAKLLILFEFCSQHLPSCYTWKMTNGFCIM